MTLHRHAAPFDEGKLAAETGLDRDQNPYERGSAEYSDWIAGYDAAKEAEDATRLDHEGRGTSD